MKRNHVFCFEPATLTLFQEGHGEKNGSAELTIDERYASVIPHTDSEGSYISVKIPRSELIELRDFLNKTIPSAPADDAEFGMSP